MNPTLTPEQFTLLVRLIESIVDEKIAEHTHSSNRYSQEVRDCAVNEAMLKLTSVEE